jgi:hypothetical protein
VACLWQQGAFDPGASKARGFARLHQKRQTGVGCGAREPPPLNRTAATALPKGGRGKAPPADVRWFINQSRQIKDEAQDEDEDRGSRRR